MTIKKIAFKCLYANNKRFLHNCNHTDLATEFMTLMGFAFADTNNFRGMNAVELVFAVTFLAKKPMR